MPPFPPPPFGGFFAGRRVLLTGHTGFKGAWLAQWLLDLGAEVTGLALDPPTHPALFSQLGLASQMADRRGDLRDPAAVRAAFSAARPEVVLHLAAQPLVRASYRDPVGTYATNVMGTVHVLEALRECPPETVAVLISTDKCYENREWEFGYREEDPLGGYDPYSSSKACVEIAVQAWRRSFFGAGRPAVASARAGNVVGGGDWAEDRIVPDAMRHLARGEPVPVRNPRAVRPWQHVLEPLSGYLHLAAELARHGAGPARDRFAAAFNFGPEGEASRTVADLVQTLLEFRSGSWVDASQPGAPHESGLLQLTIDRARHRLGWRPVWNFRETLRQTAAWYGAAEAPGFGPEAARSLTRDQTSAYVQAARERALAWAQPSLSPA